jgi:hypothetical protein
MRNVLTLIAASSLLIGLAGCDVEVEEEGRLPEMDIQTEPGQLPEYEVEQTQEGRLPETDVEVEQEGRLPEVDVQTPDVEVERDTVEVPVPDVDVIPPEEQERGQ